MHLWVLFIYLYPLLIIAGYRRNIFKNISRLDSTFLKLNPCGFFNVDAQLPPHVLCLLVTYTIVLLQFAFANWHEQLSKNRTKYLYLRGLLCFHSWDSYLTFIFDIYKDLRRLIVIIETKRPLYTTKLYYTWCKYIFYESFQIFVNFKKWNEILKRIALTAVEI